MKWANDDISWLTIFATEMQIQLARKMIRIYSIIPDPYPNRVKYRSFVHIHMKFGSQVGKATVNLPIQIRNTNS